MVFIIFYLSWQIFRINTTKKQMHFHNKTEPLFITQIYDLLINGVRTDNGVMAIDRRGFRGNNAARFAKDVTDNIINTVIIAGQPFQVRYHMMNDKFYFFRLKNLCSTFPLPACSNGLHLEALITKFVHVLGVHL